MKSKIILALAISLGFLSACNDDYEVQFNGAVDVYVRCQIIDGVPQYAPVYNAYGNMRLDTATVTLIDNTITNPIERLERVNEYTFASLPKTEDYKGSVASGEYEFTLTSTSNETLKISDVLPEERMDPITITNDLIVTEEKEIKLEWNEVEGANWYVIQIVKDETELFKAEFNKPMSEYTVTAPFLEQLETGETYSVSVSAFKVTFDRHIDQESIEYRYITW